MPTCRGRTVRFKRGRPPSLARGEPESSRPAKAVAIEAIDERRRLSFEVDPERARLTHYLFRYPAKFHPPVVAALFHRFTSPGDVVLDPFVGSGTALVEGTLLDRNASASMSTRCCRRRPCEDSAL